MSLPFRRVSVNTLTAAQLKAADESKESEQKKQLLEQRERRLALDIAQSLLQATDRNVSVRVTLDREYAISQEEWSMMEKIQGILLNRGYRGVSFRQRMRKFCASDYDYGELDCCCGICPTRENWRSLDSPQDVQGVYGSCCDECCGYTQCLCTAGRCYTKTHLQGHLRLRADPRRSTEPDHEDRRGITGITRSSVYPRHKSAYPVTVLMASRDLALVAFPAVSAVRDRISVNMHAAAQQVLIDENKSHESRVKEIERREQKWNQDIAAALLAATDTAVQVMRRCALIRPCRRLEDVCPHEGSLAQRRLHDRRPAAADAQVLRRQLVYHEHGCCGICPARDGGATSARPGRAGR